MDGQLIKLDYGGFRKTLSRQLLAVQLADIDCLFLMAMGVI
jgi:hypothetical protein